MRVEIWRQIPYPNYPVRVPRVVEPALQTGCAPRGVSSSRKGLPPHLVPPCQLRRLANYAVIRRKQAVMGGIVRQGIDRKATVVLLNGLFGIAGILKELPKIRVRLRVGRHNLCDVVE